MTGMTGMTGMIEMASTNIRLGSLGWLIIQLWWLGWLQYRSKKVDNLNSRSSRESRWESRIDSLLLRLNSRFSAPARLIKPEWPLFTNGYKGFLFPVICSLLSIVNLLLSESTIFVQVLSNLLTSLTSRKISLLHKITNSTQHLILARNSWTMQIIQ